MAKRLAERLAEMEEEKLQAQEAPVASSSSAPIHQAASPPPAYGADAGSAEVRKRLEALEKKQ